MPDDQITDAKDLVKRVSDFGEELKERRRFERKKLLWAATVEVRGQRFEGMIVDLSAGGARIKFDAPVATGDELTLMLKQLDDLGAKVVWQREGEAGLQFLLAPEEVAARIPQSLAPAPLGAGEPAAASAAPVLPLAAPDPALRTGRPARRPLGQRFVGFLALGAAAAGLLIGGGALLGNWRQAGPPPALAISGGASDQRSCSNLMGRVNGSSNQVDFSLNVASAVQAKCLDIHHLGPSDDNNGGRMVRATKLPAK
jgi:PilZ domain